jgi:hypothetical protein
MPHTFCIDGPPGSAGVPPNAAYFLSPQGAFGVRQLAAAFQKRSKSMFFTSLLKAAASCRTPKAPCGRENYTAFAARPQFQVSDSNLESGIWNLESEMM